MSIIRYPGGKKKLRLPIIAAIHDQVDGQKNIRTYIEPFVGGGEIVQSALKEFDQFQNYHINDKDIALANYWTAIIRYPEALINLIDIFQPSLEKYLEFQTELQNITDCSDDQEMIVRNGFMKLSIHSMSYSGLGERAGGPMGGKTPTAGSNRIASRWSPGRLVKKVRETHDLFSHVNIFDNCCTTSDFSDVICGSDQAFIYLDPPYFEKGSELYKHAFVEADHIRLAEMLKHTDHRWVLSYDDHPAIRELYSWAEMQIIDVQYSINGSYKKPELLIVPKPYTTYHIGLPVSL